MYLYKYIIIVYYVFTYTHFYLYSFYEFTKDFYVITVLLTPEKILTCEGIAEIVFFGGRYVYIVIKGIKRTKTAII